MADRRSIEPGMLAHPLFRRASLVAREVWLGLILMADDEGRVRLDVIALAEAIFSPLTHKVTTKKVQEALDFWGSAHEADKLPWLVVYGEGAYGFLSGWYEHQYIRPGEREKPGERDGRPGQREESSLPAPPVPVNSWQAADAVYRWYCRAQGQKKTYYRLALRALSQLPVAQQQAIVTEELRNCCATLPEQLRVEGKGGKEEGKEGKEEGENAGAPAPTAPPVDESACAAADQLHSPSHPTTAQPPAEKTLSPAELRKQRQTGLQDERAALMGRIPQSDHFLVAAYMENAAQETKNKQISLGGEVTRLQEIVAVRDELLSANAADGAAAWRYGMAQANAKSAPNPNYVKKAAASWTPGTEVASFGRASPRPQSVSAVAPLSVFEAQAAAMPTPEEEGLSTHDPFADE